MAKSGERRGSLVSLEAVHLEVVVVVVVVMVVVSLKKMGRRNK